MTVKMRDSVQIKSPNINSGSRRFSDGWNKFKALWKDSIFDFEIISWSTVHEVVPPGLILIQHLSASSVFLSEYWPKSLPSVTHQPAIHSNIQRLINARSIVLFRLSCQSPWTKCHVAADSLMNGALSPSRWMDWMAEGEHSTQGKNVMYG